MHIFLNRSFDDDKDHISSMFDYYNAHFDNILFVLYPEGKIFRTFFENYLIFFRLFETFERQGFLARYPG